MRGEVAKLFGMLRENDRNQVVCYEGNIRRSRTWRMLAGDVEACAGRLYGLHRRELVERVGILGPPSYRWVVIDLACIRAGLRSVAFPESLSAREVGGLLRDHPVDVLLIDRRVASLLDDLHVRRMHYGGGDDDDLLGVEPGELPELTPDSIQVDYSTAFSSGTSESIKAIPLRLRNLQPEPSARTISERLARLGRYLEFRRSFWSRKDNRVILFMPFSHHQQRMFMMTALFNGIDIVLSDPMNVLKHLVIEKPNIMISVPLIYDLLAERIEAKLRRLPRWRKVCLRVYNGLGVNSWSNRNFVKRGFGHVLFRDLCKLYGGRADYFVTGSAPISETTLRIFHRIGVKLYQGYGLSELGTIALSSDRSFRVGSVGKPCVEVEFGAESEILVRFDERVHDDGLAVDREGFFHTGDAGHLDKDGFLYVQGRLDEIIVLSHGEKVFPERIELRLEGHGPIGRSMVLSRDGRSLDAIICLRPGTPEGDAARDAVLSALVAHNRTAAPHLRIAGCLILPRAFAPDEGLLTGTLKLRRRAIARRYARARFLVVGETGGDGLRRDSA